MEFVIVDVHDLNAVMSLLFSAKYLESMFGVVVNEKKLIIGDYYGHKSNVLS